MSAKHRSLKRFIKAALIIYALIFISCRGPDSAYITPGSVNDPIDTDKLQIIAGSLRKEGKQAIFQGDVELKIGQIVNIFSHKTIFYYSKSDSVKLMKFIGNVQMLTDDAKITSEKAFSNNIREYIEFEGNVNVRTESGIFEYDHYKYYFNGKYRFIVPDIRAFSS